MSDTLIPCFVCGETLQTVFDNPNQPSGGTEFTTYGHYGSTFWDSFEGEALVLNICDECLHTNSERLARRKMYRRVVVHDSRGGWNIKTVVGREWLHREPVEYFEGPEDIDPVEIEPEEIGVLTGYKIEWVTDWAEIKKNILTELALTESEEQ